MLLNKILCSGIFSINFGEKSMRVHVVVTSVSYLKNKMLFLPIMIVALSSVLCYDEKYDEIDADAVIADDALFTSYLQCFLDKGPCTQKYASEFKDILPEVVTTACEKCTDIQKVKVRKIVKAIFEKKSDMAVDFRKKFDPNGDNEKTFMAFVSYKN